MYRLAPASSVIAQRLGRLGAAELLEVPQRQHLAVDRVEAVQRLLDPQEPLGPLRGLRGRGLPAQQHRGQRGGAGLRQRLAVERDLPAGVAHPGAEVMAVERRQPLADEQPQPEERRQSWGRAR